MRGPSGGGFFGGSSGPFFSPILFQWGQSNCQGQDTVTTDPKTGLPFVPTAGVVYRVNTPIQSSVTAYPYSAAHGIELSLGNDLAAAQGIGGAPIVEVKAGANGSSLVSWLPAGANYPILEGAIVAAKAASALRTVAFICQQGETEAQGGGSPGTYQADFTAFMANVRALFGPEYRVRFYVVPVNPNCPAAPDLASVVAAQTAAVAADADAVLITAFNSIFPALAAGLHYGNGQTFPMGSTVASLVTVDFANKAALAGIGVSADASLGAIFGSRLKFLNQTYDGVTTTTLADQSGNAGNTFTAVGMVVTASDATLQNQQTVEIPLAVTATSGALVTPTASPGTPFHVLWIRKLKTIAGSDMIIDSSGFNNDGFTGFQRLAFNGAVESFAGNTVTPGSANAEPANTWMFGQNQFSHQATDVVQAGRFAVQGDAGNTAASAHVRTINGYGGGNGGDIQEVVLAYVLGAVTVSEINRARNFYAKKFNVAASPLAPAVMGL